jgi:acyl phosphate:glycerol-3-phosphate acyltransferase
VASHILAAAFGYLLGSFPTAFLVVHRKSNIDVRSAGTGNVGTLNTFVVTGSKWTAAIVLLVDLLKGVLAVVLAMQLLGDTFTVKATAGVSAVLGHNFPVWLGFKGGRGLATAAGVFIALAWVVLLLWLAVWLLAYLLLREINPASALTSLIILGVALLTPVEFLGDSLPRGATVVSFRVFFVVIIGIILAKHLQPVREYLDDLRKKEKSS